MSAGTVRVIAPPAPRRLFAMPLSAKTQEAARFHRERDHRRLRAMGVGVALGALLTAGVLGVVGLKAHQVRLSYRLDALRTTRAEAEELNRRLAVELATLRSLARIEEKARRELGMVAPGRDQVVLAREFVAGGAGTSRAVPARTAAVDRGAMGERALRR
ncbi:MAG TPA: cell division protein FtsL [Methylomirabilota bacterium]|nr:cell division protein FtsL [Methylomirabilota bacterium]